ncbi:MAG: hypothetical protein QGD89_11205, partial [Actinomycetota bacterium]|nr:hypothetical protein [Actinomycetota bacterium]
MRVPHRLLTAAIVSALVATACSPATSTEVTTTVLSTTTTLSTTTSTGQHRPTTTAPLAVVRMGGELPSEVATAVAGFLSVVQDPRNDADQLDPGLVAHHVESAGALDDSYTGSATIQELGTGGSVGVVILDNGDVVLLADEGDGWQVVGAHLGSVGVDPWFGESPRRVLVL